MAPDRHQAAPHSSRLAPVSSRFLRVECTRLAAGPGSVRREADAQADCAREKGLQMQAFSRAADGIRTLDLLHGKQLSRDRASLRTACKRSDSSPWAASTAGREFTPITRSLGTQRAPGVSPRERRERRGSAETIASASGASRQWLGLIVVVVDGLLTRHVARCIATARCPRRPRCDRNQRSLSAACSFCGSLQSRCQRGRGRLAEQRSAFACRRENLSFHLIGVAPGFQQMQEQGVSRSCAGRRPVLVLSERVAGRDRDACFKRESETGLVFALQPVSPAAASSYSSCRCHQDAGPSSLRPSGARSSIR
jgi:hypothetical protein